MRKKLTKAKNLWHLKSACFTGGLASVSGFCYFLAKKLKIKIGLDDSLVVRAGGTPYSAGKSQACLKLSKFLFIRKSCL